MTTNCWRNCTTERKLAIIDGAIELGMTAGQCGMNFRGVAGSTITAFATRHGRNFGWGEQARRKASICAKGMNEANLVRNVRDRAERYGFDPSNSSVAAIFPSDRRSNLFEPAPYDEEVFA